MSDLTPAQWREIEKASMPIHWVGEERSRLMIELGVLRNVLRKSRRSNDQNALLWRLYTDILALGGESLGGWTKEDLHEYCLGEWAGWDKCTAFGRTRLKPKRRSSRLTKTEFSDYLEFICQRMAEHGIVLALPGDVAA
jgi:hypothetical protein